jgi:hypothetical protein
MSDRMTIDVQVYFLLILLFQPVAGCLSPIMALWGAANRSQNENARSV